MYFKTSGVICLFFVFRTSQGLYADADCKQADATKGDKWQFFRFDVIHAVTKANRAKSFLRCLCLIRHHSE